MCNANLKIKIHPKLTKFTRLCMTCSLSWDTFLSISGNQPLLVRSERHVQNSGILEVLKIHNTHLHGLDWHLKPGSANNWCDLGPVLFLWKSHFLIYTTQMFTRVKRLAQWLAHRKDSVNDVIPPDQKVEAMMLEADPIWPNGERGTRQRTYDLFPSGMSGRMTGTMGRPRAETQVNRCRFEEREANFPFGAQ